MMKINEKTAVDQQEESKHDKFVRLSEKRMQRTKEQLRLLSQLASSSYIYSPEEAREVVEELLHILLNVAHAYGVDCTARLGGSRFITACPERSFTVLAPGVRLLDREEIARLREELEAEVPDVDGHDIDEPEGDLLDKGEANRTNQRAQSSRDLSANTSALALEYGYRASPRAGRIDDAALVTRRSAF